MKGKLQRFLFSIFFLTSFFDSYCDGQSGINRFLTPSDSLNKNRVWIVAGTWTGIYAVTLVGLNQVWYANYPKTSFHFFNDNGEWLQMDKAGHVYTAYFESVWTTNALKWSGVSEKKAAWIGSATAFVFQTTLEIFDGFSEKWGASYSDMIANAIGSSLSLSQELLWNEQRITVKFSYHTKNYPDDVKARAEDLFGTSFAEKMIKDYNGQTYWLSVNPASFIKNSNSKFPKWLNISAGYGADGMLGGFDNVWTENGETVDRSDIARIRQFYLSPDIDFTKIKTHSAVLKTTFAILNIIKIPAPTLEVNTAGQVKFHPLYF